METIKQWKPDTLGLQGILRGDPAWQGKWVSDRCSSSRKISFCLLYFTKALLWNLSIWIWCVAIAYENFWYRRSAGSFIFDANAQSYVGVGWSCSCRLIMRLGIGKCGLILRRSEREGINTSPEKQGPLCTGKFKAEYRGMMCWVWRMAYLWFYWKTSGIQDWIFPQDLTKADIVNTDEPLQQYDASYSIAICALPYLPPFSYHFDMFQKRMSL